MTDFLNSIPTGLGELVIFSIAVGLLILLQRARGDSATEIASAASVQTINQIVVSLMSDLNEAKEKIEVLTAQVESKEAGNKALLARAVAAENSRDALLLQVSQLKQRVDDLEVSTRTGGDL